jgi:tetratricopeptide (TPR) repeat protein
MATVSLQMVFDEARRALEAGAADKAIGIAQHILVHYPRMIEGYRLLGEAQLNASQPEQAAVAFERVLQADPENVAAYYGLGLARQSLDQRPAAITAFERALEIQPNLADLRTQLMRLYAETPGSAGQFRLSRAGLGRLYARGGMFGQAIDEFRAVLDTDPNRDDVKAALAEALWRDGQEDESMDFCRDVLERQPDLLKPTVLLGYLLFATGQPQGESLWRRAAEQDSPMAMAHSLFDILPPIRLEEPVLPEFNEAEWRAKEARRVSEQPAPVAAVASTAEEDFFADSWLSSAGSAPAPTPTSRIYETEAALSPFGGSDAAEDDDDLLASLLGFSVGEPEPTPMPQPNNQQQTQPFSFDWEADFGNDAPAINEPLPTSLNDLGMRDAEVSSRSSVDTSNVQPFSFDDWGLDNDLPTPGNQTASAAGTDLDFPDIEAFSFDDDDSSKPSGVQPFSFEAEETSPSGVQPFSLDEDLGDFGGVAPFSFEDEGRPATPRSAAPAPDAGLGDVQPFSLDDWGLDDAAGSSNLKPLSTTDLSSSDDQDDFGAFKPFSLDELSLDTLEDETGNALSGPQLTRDEDENVEPSGFSWQEPSWRNQAAQNERSESSIEGESIFAKLMRNRSGDQPASNTPQPTGAADESFTAEEMNFFSLDDEPLLLDLDLDQGVSDLGSAMADQGGTPQGLPGAEEIHATSSAGTPTNQADQLPTESNSFFSLDELESEQGFSWETHATEQTSEALPGDNTGFFSLDELESEQGFSWQNDAASEPSAAPADEGMMPFSLNDFGLSDDELSALNIQPEAAGTPDAEPASAALPFSLSELGLSDDELTVFNLDEDTASSFEPTFGEATTLPMLPEDMRSDLSDTTGHSAPQDADMTPFSLADLGLDDEELSLFEQVQAEQTGGATNEAAPIGTADEVDMTPFSLSDLGLSDEELSLLDQSQQGGDATSESMDDDVNMLFADFDLPETSADSTELQGAASSLDAQDELPGSQPGEVAQAPILSDDSTYDPSATFDTEPTGNVAATPTGTADEVDMTPFSLSDLGLDDEELSLFEQVQAEQTGGATNEAAPIGTADEVDMTPFSLSDLGLSDEELSFFEEAQSEQTGATNAVTPTGTADEVDMTPFSLADLGLSDEEMSFFEEAQSEQTGGEGIAFTGQVPADQADAQDAATDVAPTQPLAAETFESPFSLADSERADVFAQADQQSTAPTASERERPLPNDTHVEHALPMDLPEGAQSVASAAEEFHPAPVLAAQAAPRTGSNSPVDNNISAIRSMLDADPDNDAMRLAVARMSQQTNDIAQAMEQYKQLIKRSSLLDEVVVDLQDAITDSDDPQMLRRLHRLLGDAYMKQNRFREAMDEYSWTLARSR